MKTRSFLLLAVPCTALLLMTAGCGSKPGDRLVGRWQGTGQSEDAGAAPDTEAVGAAMGMMQLTLEFREDRTGTSDLTLGAIPDPNPNSLNGPWQVKESGDNRLVVEYSKTVDSEKVSGQMEIEFLSDNQITIKYSDEADLPKFLLSRGSGS
jgi:hypothetical protein